MNLSSNCNLGEFVVKNDWLIKDASYAELVAKQRSLNDEFVGSIFIETDTNNTVRVDAFSQLTNEKGDKEWLVHYHCINANKQQDDYNAKYSMTANNFFVLHNTI